MAGKALPIAGCKGCKTMSRRKKIYEGKAKILYQGPNPDNVVVYFKDSATAFNNEKKGQISGKGIINNRISEYLMEHLSAIGIQNHFIRRLNMREQLVKKVEIIPVEVIVRNVVAGSLAKRLGLEEGMNLPRAIVEYCYKSDELQDPVISDEHILALGWATSAELDEIMGMTLRINDFLSGLFAAIGVRLVDFKLEFGRYFIDEDTQMQIILADELSPDNMRLWDIKTGKKLDKDRFRRDLGGVEEAYIEIAQRLGMMQDHPNDHLDA